MNALWVFLGGGTGAVLRWMVGTWVPAPWGTLTVNVIGSLLLAALLHEAHELPEPVRLGLGTGLMGGFTTYSTFNHEVLSAAQEGEPGRAAILAALSLVGCLLGGLLGWWLADVLHR